MKVLIAEDDTASRLVLQNHLEQWGHEVLSASNGTEALQAFCNHNPAIVVIDWIMPVMDGLELCRHIRKTQTNGYTYIIFLTSKSQNSDIVTALDAGADDYLSKPFDKSVLKSRIAVGVRAVAYEKQLLRSEERCQRITDSITDYIFTLKISDSKITETIHGDASIAVTGYPANQLEQEPNLWAEMIHPDDRDFVGDRIHKCINGRPVEPAEYRITRKDGQIRWVRSTLVQHFNSKGLLIACDCLLHDITERKNAEDDLILAKVKAEQSQEKLIKLNAQLEQTYKKLMDSAHLAGMAEVAANVLHNVGNALNSINVSAGLVTEKMTLSEIPNLKKVADIAYNNRDNLADFLQNDQQGKHILTYLKELSTKLCDEQDENITKLNSLMENVKHVKGIIKKQQQYTNATEKTVSVSIKDVIEDALNINHASLQRCNIDVIRDYHDMPNVYLDKQQALQILVNLIDNAAAAMEQSNTSKKTLTIIAHRRTSNKFRIVISDNGIGIKPANIDKVFKHGYTTKSQGHGFGLQSCMLAAKNMQGKITVTSGGEDRGATFTLELPLKLIEVKHA